MAEVVAAAPARVAFGTVAELASRSGSSGPTVLRLAVKLGFDGFADLRSAVQDELSEHLRPAVERIRTATAGSPLHRASDIEVGNVRSTLAAVDPATFDRTVRLLAHRRSRVHVLAGEDAGGVAATVARELDLLRPRVEVVGGSPVALARTVAGIEAGDVVLAIELRRYERWVLEAAAAARTAGAALVAVTDSLVSPLAEGASEVFVVSAGGVGPFDSHVGILALGNALVAGVALRLRASATARLDAVEAATAVALTDG